MSFRERWRESGETGVRRARIGSGMGNIGGGFFAAGLFSQRPLVSLGGVALTAIGIFVERSGYKRMLTRRGQNQ